jgi:hypothetical protein
MLFAVTQETYKNQTLEPIFKQLKKGTILDLVTFYVLYSILLHLPPLRFHCAGGCWDRTQDCCDFGIGWQTL